jgi:hypothetical protein
MAATITQISSPPNFIMNEILICFYFWVLHPVECTTKVFWKCRSSQQYILDV